MGLDAGFKVNASLVDANVGFFNANVGVGSKLFIFFKLKFKKDFLVDSGVKFGKEGVGLKVLGTSFQVGRVTKISLFGSSFSMKLR